MDTERKIDLMFDLPASAERVWRALTEAREIERWFAPEVKAEQRLAGARWASWGPGMEGSERIDAWEPPNHLRTVSDGSSATVDYFLEGRGQKTTLRLVHAGFDSDAALQSCRYGWGVYLAMLAFGLRRHSVSPAKPVCLLRGLEEPPAQVWQRLTGPEGLGFTPPLASLRPGDRLEARRGGEVLLRGRLELYERWGYVCLSSQSEDALLGLFVEGGDKTLLTLSWVLFGKAVTQAEELRERWQAILAGL